jgi:hypothetical protein
MKRIVCLIVLVLAPVLCISAEPKPTPVPKRQELTVTDLKAMAFDRQVEIVKLQQEIQQIMAEIQKRTQKENQRESK